MSIQDKIIASLLLLHSATGVIWTFWLASRIEYPFEPIAANVGLAVTGAIAGIGWFHRRRWARVLAALYFLVQVFHLVTPGFEWSYMLGFNLTFSLSDSGNHQFGVNLFALAMLVWVAVRIFAPDEFKPNPLRGSA